MGHDKLRKFAENETFDCLVQPSAAEILKDGYFNLSDHPLKGHWNRDIFSVSDKEADSSGCSPLKTSASRTPSTSGYLPLTMPRVARFSGGTTAADSASQMEREICVELGCGKGEYTIDLAKRFPERNYIGVDIKGARLWKGAKYATENGMKNVAFLRTRIEFITALFGKDEISEIWLTFSDPQLKSENSRLSSPLFLERYRSFLKKGGIVNLKTDSRFLYEYTKAVCEENSLEILASTTDLYGGQRLPMNELYEVQTFYEKMFLAQGYKINYLRFRIDHEGPYAHPSGFDAAYWRSVEGPRRSFGHETHKQ